MQWTEFTHQVAGRLKGESCLPLQNQHFEAWETTPTALPEQGYDPYHNPNQRHLSLQ